jgi:hypothetical protein
MAENDDKNDFGPPDYYSRKEVAKLLGISERSVQRLDSEALDPVHDATTGRVWYHRSQVDELCARRKRGNDEAEPAAQAQPIRDLEDSGRVAAMLYRLFRKGMSDDEIVIETEKDPEIVSRFRRTWAASHDHVISAAEWDQLRRMLPAVKSVEDLISTIKMLVTVFCAVRDIYGSVTTAEQLQEKVRGLLADREELRRFACQCSECGRWFQATAKREWAELMKAGAFEGWPCEECVGKVMLKNTFKKR